MFLDLSEVDVTEVHKPSTFGFKLFPCPKTYFNYPIHYWICSAEHKHKTESNPDLFDNLLKGEKVNK